MAYSSSIIKSDIYAMFKEIDRSSFRNIIQLYENHLGEIQYLDEEESLELHVIYLRSLFEIKSFENFLNQVDEAIEGVIFMNVVKFEEEDVYEELLYKKAMALYRVMRYEDAAYICGQLLKMNSKNDMASLLLRKIYVYRKPAFLQTARALSVGLFLATAVFCAIELLLLTSQFEAHQPKVEVVRIAAFCLGLLLLGGSQLFHYLQSRYRIEKQIR